MVAAQNMRVTWCMIWMQKGVWCGGRVNVDVLVSENRSVPCAGQRNNSQELPVRVACDKETWAKTAFIVPAGQLAVKLAPHGRHPEYARHLVDHLKGG